MPTMVQGFKDGETKWFEGGVPSDWSLDDPNAEEAPKKRGRPKKEADEDSDGEATD